MAESRVTLVGWPGRGAALLREGVQFQQSLYAAAGDIAAQLRVIAVNESPVGQTPTTGPRFRDSWVTEVEPEYQGGARITLGNQDPKTPFVIGPTRPHPIYANHQLGATATGSSPRPLNPNELGYLRFQVGGQTLFRHMVNHPGTKLNDIPGRVDAQMQPRYAGIMQERVGDLAVRITSIFS